MKKILMLLLLSNILFSAYYIEYGIRIETTSFGFYDCILNWFFETAVTKIEYEKHVPIKAVTGFSITAWDYNVRLTTRKYYK